MGLSDRTDQIWRQQDTVVCRYAKTLSLNCIRESMFHWRALKGLVYPVCRPWVFRWCRDKLKPRSITKFYEVLLWINFDGIFMVAVRLLSASFSCCFQLSAEFSGARLRSGNPPWCQDNALDCTSSIASIPALVVMATLVVNGGDDHLMVAICGNGIAKSLHGSFCQDCSSTAYKMVKGFQPHRMASIICGCRMYIVYNSIHMYTVTWYCWQLVWPGRESLYASFASAEAMTCWYILTVASLHVGHLPLFGLDVESRRSVYSICLWKIWKQLRSKAWAFQVFAICLTVLPCVWDSGSGWLPHSLYMFRTVWELECSH